MNDFINALQIKTKTSTQYRMTFSETIPEQYDKINKITLTFPILKTSTCTNT